ncbi:biopolymer transport protein ExbD/TolR [Lacinutrix venerupis]|uniref:Biopolymer transporter ExbD n=1 Tax=Lacinutrix venerupis TaxID=1486034 RepID=A0AAC9LKR2_9FLAO|nr:biopolymer transporter ExbD [Lacinutrix venerupis]APX99171.1 biopolymer transporter ExbD [Lacinutrix venerupis]RLJ65543.1 biopolymer transport protein ExbD/TolR [Lacinutrix venerupis]
MAKRSAPEVNAGSMADIAFLLLIFFLVTTDIATDSGLSRKLPPWEEDTQEPVIIKEKNIFALTLNSNNEILLTSGGDSEVVALKDLRAATVKFLDNGGGEGKDACKRCKGAGDPASSDNLQKAVISLANDRLTDYKTYIAVQNEILAAYNEIRNREFKRDYPNLEMNFVEATAMYQDPVTEPKVRENLKEKLEAIKLIVPQKFSEAEAKRD